MHTRNSCDIIRVEYLTQCTKSILWKQYPRSQHFSGGGVDCPGCSSGIDTYAAARCSAYKERLKMQFIRNESVFFNKIFNNYSIRFAALFSQIFMKFCYSNVYINIVHWTKK